LLATVGGGLLIAGAGLKLVGVGFKVLVVPLEAMMVIPFAGIASGLILLTAALAALVPIVFHKEIANWIDNKAPGVGDFLYNATTPSEWGSLGGHHSKSNWYSQVSAGATGGGSKPVQVTTNVNLDGRQIASVVSDHQYSSFNRDLSSGSGFDGKLSFVAPGVP
jgi:hypothetical protein